MVNVVDFAKLRTISMKRRRKRIAHCRCLGVWVDEQTRFLECKNCGASVDPFDYVLLWAKKEESLTFELSSLKKEVHTLQKTKELLKSEVVNLKAQKRRAK